MYPTRMPGSLDHSSPSNIKLATLVSRTYAFGRTTDIAAIRCLPQTCVFLLEQNSAAGTKTPNNYEAMIVEMISGRQPVV